MSPVTPEHEALLVRYLVQRHHAMHVYMAVRQGSPEETPAEKLLDSWSDAIRVFLKTVIHPAWGITEPVIQHVKWDDYQAWYGNLLSVSRRIAAEERYEDRLEPTLFMAVEL